jgi:hypothetical protein
VLRLEQWAEIRRLYFVKRLSIKEVARRTGHGRNTNRPTLRSAEPPRYRQRGPSAAGTRIRERLCESGRAGSKMILDKLLCEVRPLLFCHAAHQVREARDRHRLLDGRDAWIAPQIPRPPSRGSTTSVGHARGSPPPSR